LDTAKLTSKGQLVIPKRIRDAVRATPGTEFQVRLEGGRIILELRREKHGKLADWPGLNPAGIRLTDAQLCKPVVLTADDDRR